MKYTPHPWFFDGDGDLRGPDAFRDIVLMGDSLEGDPITHNDDPEVAAGNKRLIENAALMYEALQKVHRLYRDAINYYRPFEGLASDMAMAASDAIPRRGGRRMTTDERLFAWFLKHPKALPANIRTYDNGDDQTHGFYKSVSGIGVENYALNDPVLGNRVPKIVQLGLTMALLRWVSERDHKPCLIVHAPGVYSGQWTVGYGRHGEEVSADDILTALLDAAEAMEGDDAE
jgi:hypothetical protein